MTKIDIQELSDDDDGPLVPAACPKPDKPPSPAERPSASSSSVPTEDRVPAVTPARKEPKKKAKAKAKTGKSKPKAGAKSADDDGDTPASTPLKRPAAASVPDGDQDQEPAVPAETDVDSEMKRPAAAPAKKPKKSEAIKRPAASKPAALKAYKYMYHKEVKFGVKYGGREMVTVRVLSCILCWDRKASSCFLPATATITLEWSSSLRSVGKTECQRKSISKSLLHTQR